MIGLVLEGGGAKGAYHIGVYKALMEMGIHLDGAVGTSIGAVNAAMIVQGQGEVAWDIWSNLNSSSVFDVDDEKWEDIRAEGVTRKNISYIAAKVGNIIKRGGLSTSVMMDFLRAHLDEEAIRSSLMDFGLVTVSLTAMKSMELMKEDIPQGELLDYIMASASFPGFKTEKVDGHRFIDGGLFDNLPLSLLVNKGYTTLIAVRTNAIGRNRKTDTTNVNVIEIEPREELSPILDFNEETARHDLNLGYYDAMRVFNQYRGARYYIKSHPDSDWFFKSLAGLHPLQIKRAAEVLGIESMVPRRMLFERIIPTLTKIFDMDDEMDYEDLVLAIYESVATTNGLEKFKIYESEEFLGEVEALYNAGGTKTHSWIPRFVKSNPRLSKFVKADILNDIIELLLSRGSRITIPPGF